MSENDLKNRGGRRAAAGEGSFASRFPKSEPQQGGQPSSARKKAQGRRRPPKVPRSMAAKLLIALLWLAAALTLAVLLVLLVGYNYLAKDLPSTAGLKNYRPPIVTYFYSDDGRIIGEYYHERRFVKPLSEIPQVLKDAFLAVEDASFYEHRGVNPKAMLRAFVANLKADGIAQGGSTITQQVVKTFLLTPQRSYRRKFQEMILALRIESNLSKDEILYLYLNQIYLGKGAYGVEAAAQTYFAKPVSELSVAEAAMLAGLTRSPNENPVNTPRRAREKQLASLNRMLQVGAISEAEAEAARAERLNIQSSWPSPNTTVAPYFTEHVRRIMEEKFGADSLYNDGWKVYTTVNIEAQQAADMAVAQGVWEYSRRRRYNGPLEHLEENQFVTFEAQQAEALAGRELEPYHFYKAIITEVDAQKSSLSVSLAGRPGLIEKKNLDWALKNKGSLDKSFRRGDVIWVGLDSQNSAELNGSEPLALTLERNTDLESALLSMDPRNGDVKAMVGGRNFDDSQFNRAVQSQRQPGSSFKPIVYAAALDNGFTPGSIMLDTPLVIDDKGSGRRWKPVNSDLKFKGPMSLYSALVASRNLISIKLLDRIGYEALEKTAADLGITETLPRSLTMALGAHGLPLPQLLTAYSAFANMGPRAELRYITKIEDRDGNVVELFEPHLFQALDPGTACAVNWMLQGVVDHGTGTVVKALGRPVAGKTGTTNDYSDAWFIGFTPQLVTAIWVGTDQQRPRAVGEVGGRAAGPIFLYYMRQALKDVEPQAFTPPLEAELVTGGGGGLGVCYKVGTVGTGLSETMDYNDPEDSFLRGDFEAGEDPLATEDGESFDWEEDFSSPSDQPELNWPPAAPSEAGAAQPALSYPAAEGQDAAVNQPQAPAAQDLSGEAAASEEALTLPEGLLLWPAPEPTAEPEPAAAPQIVVPAQEPAGRLPVYGEDSSPRPGRLPVYGQSQPDSPQTKPSGSAWP